MFKLGVFFKSGLVASLMTLSFLISFSAHGNEAQSDTRQLMQIAEYINVDYREAIKNGEIISQGEYDEMLEFSALCLLYTSDAADE